jgi:WD40 repeat protein
VAFSQDGRYLAYSHAGGISLAEVASHRIQHELVCDSDAAEIAFSPDGLLLATGHQDSAIRVWSRESGHLEAEFTNHQRPVRSLAFSPDGRTLLSSAADGTVRVWSVSQYQALGIAHQVNGKEADPSGTFYCDLSLSMQGRRLAIACAEAGGPTNVTICDLQFPVRAEPE